MRRVSRRCCEDGPLLEEQETEGQRQLHGLLLRQLHTDVDIDRCVAKKRCFTPAAIYKPFGQQAAGVRSLSQFQALQDGEQELASLRELGLTEAEIQLWQSRDDPEIPENCHGVCAAPGVKQERLQVIRDKIAVRAEILARPQRFATSQALSRREMEIEQALFQGNDRLGFLAALYHHDENNQDGQQGATSSDPMETLYRDLLTKEKQQASLQEPRTSHIPKRDPTSVQSNDLSGDQSEDASQNELQEEKRNRSEQSKHQGSPAVEINISQPIGSLCVAVRTGSCGPLTVKGEVAAVTEEEILENRETEEDIRRIPRFRNYQPGNPSKVLCVRNLSAQASVAQLVALFSRFECASGPPVLYRLLTGRMKGQAFISLPDTETAQKALELVHGYRLLGKPLVVEFGRERQEAEEKEERKK
ncbi:RNA-binding protein 41 [Dunckerocampus dactyliophorus]|uniref:RNA-binding protein 41 n=1 Tax=Dunckerocampus dactyliophorus TaxID=161453 RepID=UPI0024058C03|nr:RNA-binding protein 41 [Dunckerocampus dactyliophorus]XP_054612153.1 RNA-binding protein 41 [Dunckerocampus dactyliophorus]